MVVEQRKGLRTLAESSHRRLGAYYTPEAAARLMADWAIRDGTERVLEPAMGDGEFLRAAKFVADRDGHGGIETWGVELAADTYAATVASGLLPTERAILGDFVAVRPFPVDVVIGNPPYVRLRHLPPMEAKRARARAADVLGDPMEADGSLWMPFVLHGTRFLALGGRLAFVLPYDLTYVRYARPLWRYLGAHFRELRVLRVHQRVFPDILQDVVLLLADGWGGSTASVEFEAFETGADLVVADAVVKRTIGLEAVVAGERPFTEALLPPGLTPLLRDRVYPLTSPAREHVTFHIGYVAGHKRFFHPSEADIAKYGIPKSSLIPALTSGRRLRAAGAYSSNLPASAAARLFLPPIDTAEHAAGELRYIRSGVRSKVSKGYKASSRDPWWRVPDVRVPDLVLPVFADTPALVVNDAGYVVSNSLLAGFVKRHDAESFVSRWYTSLTLLEVELNVHSLGGGVMVFVPNEAGAVRVVDGEVGTTHMAEADCFLRSGRYAEAYASGDDQVLRGVIGLDGDEIDLIRKGTEALRHWRTGRA